MPLIPTADEWAQHVDYVIKLVGADHVAIGLDMAGGRSSVPRNPAGYGEIVAALNRIRTPAKRDLGTVLACYDSHLLGEPQ